MTLKEKLMPPRITTNSRSLIDAEAVQKLLNDWYDQHLTPLFENAVEVYHANYDDVLFGNAWTDHQDTDDTHRALLIGIEPLQKGVTKEAKAERGEYG